jgi:hypothetical protein
LANLNNFKLIPPPGVTASLVNNTANHTVDLNVTAVAATTWIPLDATDTAGTSSFEVAGHWSDGNPPTAGNGYYTKSFMLRTPADANSYTFAGSILSIDAYTFAGNVGGKALAVRRLLFPISSSTKGSRITRTRTLTMASRRLRGTSR